MTTTRIKDPLQKAKNMFHTHTLSARDRKIEFCLTFNEWYNWWLDKGVDKNGPSQKALGISRANTLCMCRKGDVGPYSLDNIYCDTASGNAAAVNKNKHQFSRKEVTTSEGYFRSIKEWCEHTGKSRTVFAKRYPHLSRMSGNNN